MLTVDTPLSPGAAAVGEATHTVRRATVTLAHAGQAALLRAALPMALQAVLDGVAATASAASPQRGGAPAGPAGRLWLLRHLPCRLRLPAGADLHQAVQALQRALQQAWVETARQVQPVGEPAPWLVLEDASDAWLSAWADALSGRNDRAWAWARLGLWPQGDGNTVRTADRLAALLQALDRQPLIDAEGPEPGPAQRRRALLAHWLQQGLLVRALSLLTPAQCLRLAQGLPGHAALAAAMGAGQSDDPASRSQESGGLQTADGPKAAFAWPEGPEAAACRAALALAPLPAQARGPAALWLAWLAQLQADPGALAGQALPRVQARLQALARAALAPPAAPARPAHRRPPPDTREPEPTNRWPTRHGGLVHLLPLLAEALPAHAEGWSRTRLLRLAVHGLQVPLGDPVLAPWLGASAPAAWADLPVKESDGSAAALRADVQALLLAVQGRLQSHLAPERRADIEADPWPWLLQRPALLLAGPGRWEVLFDTADTRLRLCGLDRDPGFLPWLGLHVVLRYE